MKHPLEHGSHWLGQAMERSTAQDPDEDKGGTRRYRTVFISDLHLGTPGCRAEDLLNFLKASSCEHLYLVGDIIDGWQLRRRWFWPQAHNDVVQKLLRAARKGCRVTFVPGNHDEFARGFIGHQFGGIEVVDDAVHTTAAGQRLWVTHGDYFDGVIQYAKWLAYVGDNLYEFALRLNAAGHDSDHHRSERPQHWQQAVFDGNLRQQHVVQRREQLLRRHCQWAADT